jgi:hypothetical protein
MKEIFLALIIMLMGIFILTEQAQHRATIEAHHKYVRQQELDMADMKSRMTALEDVQINVNIVDRTGLYTVMSTEVE